jgi:hypothetical protein
MLIRVGVNQRGCAMSAQTDDPTTFARYALERFVVENDDLLTLA